LYILRHAKSDWNQALPDLQRPLSPRGKKATSVMGQLTHALSSPVDAILTSPAKRAHSTAAGIQAALIARGSSVTLCLESAMYEADVEQLLSIITRLDPQFRSVMLVGHNPGFEELVAVLCAMTGSSGLRMPTATLAHITFHQPDWHAIRPGTGQLEGLYPARVMGRFFELCQGRP